MTTNPTVTRWLLKITAEDGCLEKLAKNWLLKIAVEDGCWRVGWGGLRSIQGRGLQSDESSRKSLVVGRSLVKKVSGANIFSGVKGIWCKTVWHFSYLVQISGVLAFCCRSRLVWNAFGERVLWFGLKVFWCKKSPAKKRRNRVKQSKCINGSILRASC